MLYEVITVSRDVGDRPGFTIVETLVALSLGWLVAFLVLTTLRNNFV